MKSKWIAVALVAMMLLGMGSLAFAAEANKSITIDDIDTNDEPQGLADEVTAALQAFVDNGGAAADYFGADVVKEMDKLLPSGVTAEDLDVVEVLSIAAAAYSEAELKAGIELDFPTQFSKDDIVIVLVGVADGKGGVIWTPVKATITNGKAILKFPAKLASQMAASAEPASFVVFKGKK